MTVLAEKHSVAAGRWKCKRRERILKNRRAVNCWLASGYKYVNKKDTDADVLCVNMTDPWLRAGEGEQVHFAKVISRGQQGSVMWPAHSVDVCAVCSIRPNSWENEWDTDTARERELVKGWESSQTLRFTSCSVPCCIKMWNAVQWPDQRSIWTFLHQQNWKVKM